VAKDFFVERPTPFEWFRTVAHWSRLIRGIAACGFANQNA
jgi:hypothetical protein